MGLPMARRLCEAGFEVAVWNRTPTKAWPLTAYGAAVFETPEQAVAGASLVICMLENGPITHGVLFSGTAQAMAQGAMVIDMASIKPDEARAHAQQLESLGLRHLDAPVSGGTLGAERGTLAIMVGGDAADFERALPVFKHLGRATHVGPMGSGQLCKLANQLIVGIGIGAVAEALLLVSRGGADPAQFKAAVAGGFADSPILQIHGQRMIDGDFSKRGAMSVQLKDMNNIAHQAQQSALHLPIGELLQNLYSRACAQGLGELDHSALHRFLEHAAPGVKDGQVG